MLQGARVKELFNGWGNRSDRRARGWRRAGEVRGLGSLTSAILRLWDPANTFEGGGRPRARPVLCDPLILSGGEFL